jgi:hypothetical protein
MQQTASLAAPALGNIPQGGAQALAAVASRCVIAHNWLAAIDLGRIYGVSQQLIDLFTPAGQRFALVRQGVCVCVCGGGRGAQK